LVARAFIASYREGDNVAVNVARSNLNRQPPRPKHPGRGAFASTLCEPTGAVAVGSQYHDSAPRHPPKWRKKS
jgi:hypothetical protein